MADVYTSSMFGGEFPYWQEKYGDRSLGYDFKQGKEYKSYLTPEEENKVLASTLNYFGVTPDMGITDVLGIYGDVKDKYSKKSWIPFSERKWDAGALNNVMKSIWGQSGLDQSKKLGWQDTASMMRKYLLTKGLLNARGPEDDPTVNLGPLSFQASPGKGSWNEFYDLGLDKLGSKFRPKEDEVVEIIEYQGG